jgi:integrase
MSPVRRALSKYVRIRRALGAQFKEPAQALRHFVEFLESEGAEFITTELAVRWAVQPRNVQQATLARRLSAVRGFASWVSVFDPRTEVPARGILRARHRRGKPYIFTTSQIQKLMEQSARLRSVSGLRALTYTTLIGLLAATGLRPGEALALDVADVDLECGVLKIRQSKFGKSRFVPIEESTRAALAHYAEQRDALFPYPFRQSCAFLISEYGERVQRSAAGRTFAKLSAAIGLRRLERRRVGRGPRLQDIRHTFATRGLIEWYRSGVDVERELPKLSTYLGHGDVAHTYWYIEAVPELLQLATNRLMKGGPR